MNVSMQHWNVCVHMCTQNGHDFIGSNTQIIHIHIYISVLNNFVCYQKNPLHRNEQINYLYILTSDEVEMKFFFII